MIDFLTGLTIGLHVASAHFPANDNYNNFNPGVYVVSGSGWTLGTYRNTLRRQSVYFGRQFDWGPLSLTVGGVTGYKREYFEGNCGNGLHSTLEKPCWRGTSNSSIWPMLAPSLHFGAARVWFMPGLGNSSSVVHFSLEHRF